MCVGQLRLEAHGEELVEACRWLFSSSVQRVRNSMLKGLLKLYIEFR